MEPDSQLILDYLVNVEGIADEILSQKQDIIELDKRRNKTREAIRFFFLSNFTANFLHMKDA